MGSCRRFTCKAPMNNIYLYVRASRDQQDRRSFERQLKYARAYCPTLMEDREHVFCELERFCDAVTAGTVPAGSTLLVEDFDYLSHPGMWKASDKLREFREYGIAVVMTAGRRIAASYASRYLKARDGAKVKVLLPGWIEWVSATEYRLKEAEAAVVRRIFEMAAAGSSYGAIVRTLNQEGIAPFRSRGKGKLWIAATVFGIVKSQAAIGVYTPRDGGPPIEDYFPAVVSRDLFHSAQGGSVECQQDKVARASAEVNLWAKVGCCAMCGQALHLRRKGPKDLRYLVCSGKGAIGCKALNISVSKAELVFLELLANVVHADCFAGGARQADQERRQLAGQIQEQQAIKARLVALLNVDPMPEVVAAIRKANFAIAALEAKHAELDRAPFVALGTQAGTASLMDRIDLGSTEGRMEANSLLRRLKIKVAVLRTEQRTSYRVEQDGKPVLQFFDAGGKVIAVPFSRSVAVYEQEPVVESEYSLA